MGEPPELPGRTRWRAEIREVGVIALGILIAFAVDASWDAFREESQLNNHLDAVDAEIEQNIRALRELESESRSMFQAGAALVALSGPNAVADVQDSIRQLVTTLWRPPRSDFSQGALEALRSSGLLAEVRDPELRGLLATWPDRLRYPLFPLDLAQRRFETFFTPLLHSYVSEVDLTRADPFAVHDRFREVVQPSQFPADYTGLLRNRQVESLIGQRASLGLIAAGLSLEVQDDAFRIRQLLKRN